MTMTGDNCTLSPLSCDISELSFCFLCHLNNFTTFPLVKKINPKIILSVMLRTCCNLEEFLGLLNEKYTLLIWRIYSKIQKSERHTKVQQDIKKDIINLEH